MLSFLYLHAFLGIVTVLCYFSLLFLDASTVVREHLVRSFLRGSDLGEVGESLATLELRILNDTLGNGQ